MKIANISLNDLSGGASIFAKRQHESFLKKNINSKFFIFEKKLNSSSVKIISFKKNSKNNIIVAKNVDYNSFGENVCNNIFLTPNENVFWLEPKSNFWTKMKLLFRIYKSLKNF